MSIVEQLEEAGEVITPAIRTAILLLEQENALLREQNRSLSVQLPEHFFEPFLAQLSALFSAPSSDLPSVRCISRSSLKHLLIEIREEIAVPGYKRISGNEMIRHLVRSRLLDPIRVLEPNGETVERFYAVGIAANAAGIEAVELLMALQVDGVVCYFTALHFHSLTTQIPSHHHIARLKNWGSRSTAAATGALRPPSEQSFNPLGTERFTYRGIPYYTTDRDRALLPGVQTRYLSDKSLVRITTLEQTLIDTLHRPLSCGGPEVVYEAWETALDGLDEARLLEYLERIDDPALERRIGFLLESRGYEAGPRLRARLAAVVDAIAQDRSTEVISLFQGYSGSLTKNPWLVEAP